MASNRVLEQHIAVFGESGSGKTVMLSSFYGSEQEPQNMKVGTFNLVAEEPGQGTRLHQNYLGMKNAATVPDATKFSATSYRFLLKLKGESAAKPLKAKPFDALRLVWHDYPGEWFEQDVSGSEETDRRIAAFRALLSSHVALLLVDGQKLLDNRGHEERYLKSLLGNLRNSIVLLRDELLDDGKPLVTFPRIWVIGLSKADLLPDLDVNAFKELIIQKVGSEIAELRSLLGGMAESAEALSVGEDFVLISSAKFNPDDIEVTQRIGLDLILPMAAVMPLERHLRWAQTDKLTKGVARKLVGNAEFMAAGLGLATGVVAKMISKNNKVAGLIGLTLSSLTPKIEDAIKSAGAKLEASDAAAATKQENLAATLDRFRQDLEDGEAKAVLARSVG